MESYFNLRSIGLNYQQTYVNCGPMGKPRKTTHFPTVVQTLRLTGGPMSGPKRQREAHKSYLVTPIEYAKGFVYFCHIADLESSSQDGSQPGCEDDLGAKQTGGGG